MCAIQEILLFSFVVACNLKICNWKLNIYEPKILLEKVKLMCLVLQLRGGVLKIRPYFCPYQ